MWNLMVVSALLNLRLTVLYSIRKDALHSTEVCQRSVTICCLSQAPQLSQRVSVSLQVYLGLSLRRAGYTPHTRRDVVPHCPAAPRGSSPSPAPHWPPHTYRWVPLDRTTHLSTADACSRHPHRSPQETVHRIVQKHTSIFLRRNPER